MTFPAEIERMLIEYSDENLLDSSKDSPLVKNLRAFTPDTENSGWYYIYRCYFEYPVQERPADQLIAKFILSRGMLFIRNENEGGGVEAFQKKMQELYNANYARFFWGLLCLEKNEILTPTNFSCIQNFLKNLKVVEVGYMYMPLIMALEKADRLKDFDSIIKDNKYAEILVQFCGRTEFTPALFDLIERQYACQKTREKWSLSNWLLLANDWREFLELKPEILANEVCMDMITNNRFLELTPERMIILLTALHKEYPLFFEEIKQYEFPEELCKVLNKFLRVDELNKDNVPEEYLKENAAGLPDNRIALFTAENIKLIMAIKVDAKKEEIENKRLGAAYIMIQTIGGNSHTCQNFTRAHLHIIVSSHIEKYPSYQEIVKQGLYKGHYKFYREGTSTEMKKWFEKQIEDRNESCNAIFALSSILARNPGMKYPILLTTNHFFAHADRINPENIDKAILKDAQQKEKASARIGK